MRARLIAPTPYAPRGSGAGAGRPRRGQARLAGQRVFGELELLAAAHAHRVVEFDHLAALRALAAQFAVVPPVEDRAGQTDERHAERDQEPHEEARALHASDDTSGHPEEEQDDDQAHSGHLGTYQTIVFRAQSTASTAAMTTTVQNTAVTMPMITLTSTAAATTRTSPATALRTTGVWERVGSKSECMAKILAPPPPGP